MQIIRDD